MSAWRSDPLLHIERAAKTLLDEAAAVFTHASEDRENLSYVGEMQARVRAVKEQCDTILFNLGRCDPRR